MISFWCSVSTRFFFGEGAILTYSYRQEILTSNYIIMSLLFSGEMVTESITIILVMCTLVTSIVVTCHWNGQHSLTDIDQPGHRRRTWTAAIFSSHAYWPGNFWGVQLLGSDLSECMKKLQKTKDKLEAVTPNTVFILILSLPLSRLLVLTLWKYWHWGISTTKNVERLLCGDVFSLGIYWNNG